MSPRRYVMDNRARTAEETRRRIVEATYALHAERAIGDTTMKDIAERADVGLGTVYHYFPTYNDAVHACGAHTFMIAAPPDVTIFQGANSLDARVTKLAEELFAFYERCPGIAKARADQHKFEALKGFMSQWNAAFAHLVNEALRPAENAPAFAPAVLALLDFDVHARLVAAGFTTADAAQLMAAMLIDFIKKGQGGARPATQARRNR
jgi:AcrR family transcriptional regulator